MDSVSEQVAMDVLAAYNSLSAVACDTFLGLY